MLIILTFIIFTDAKHNALRLPFLPAHDHFYSRASCEARRLAGIYYGCGGENGVPDEWIAQIPRRDWIKALCDELIIEN